MRRSILPVLAATAALWIAGCSNSDNGTNPPQGTNSTTWDAANKVWVTKVDATSSTQYTYYSFTTKDIVTLTDAQAKTSTAWDLAFKRNYIKTNGGSSGPGGAKGADLVTLSLVNENQFSQVTASTIANLTASDWKADSYKFAVDSLWHYDIANHVLTPSKYLYVLKDATGHSVKFQVTNVYNAVQPPAMGQIVMKFTYQADSLSTDVSGAPEVDTVDGSSPTGFYYNFASHSVVNPGNPSTSLDWDIRMYAYDTYLNSSLFGPGKASAFAVYDGLTDKTNFNELQNLNQFPVPRYVVDDESSIFTVTDWFNYDDNSHTLSSKMRTYVVSVGGKNYKVLIVSYYNAALVSANYTINWVEL